MNKSINEDKKLEDLISDYNMPDEIEEMKEAKAKTRVQAKVDTRKPNTIPHRNYKKLMEIARGMIEGRYNYLKFKSEGFMDLTFERLDYNRISITHYYLQNEDLMRDPDMELIVDNDKETIMAATFRQDNLGIVQQVYLEDNRWSPKLSKKLNNFLNEWLRNIKSQRYKPFEAHLLEYNDETITFDDNGKEVIFDEELFDFMAKEQEIRKPHNSKLDIDNAEAYLRDNSNKSTDIKNVVYDLDEPSNAIDEDNLNSSEENNIPKINYIYNAKDGIGIGGAKSKYKQNIEAIKTLKVIEKENRSATPDEQIILTRYNGWGGLANEFDSHNNQWCNEYHELKDLLSPDEYVSARESTPNSHYTSPVVIKAIYKVLEQMGFKKGSILEPSMGVGNFFAHLPNSMKDSKFTV